MIIGTLPVVIPVFANLLYSQRDGKLAWEDSAPALIVLWHRLASVNIAELNHGLPDFDWARYSSGIVLALSFRHCSGMVCPAQRPLAAGKSRQTSDDVGDGAGAGHAAGFSHRLSRRLLLAEYTNAGLLLTFSPVRWCLLV